MKTKETAKEDDNDENDEDIRNDRSKVPMFSLGKWTCLTNVSPSDVLDDKQVRDGY